MCESWREEHAANLSAAIPDDAKIHVYQRIPGAAVTAPLYPALSVCLPVCSPAGGALGQGEHVLGRVRFSSATGCRYGRGNHLRRFSHLHHSPVAQPEGGSGHGDVLRQDRGRRLQKVSQPSRRGEKVCR